MRSRSHGPKLDPACDPHAGVAARARYRQVGDGARHGAVQLLVAREQRLAARSLARKVRYIELTTHRAFTEMFMLLMQL